MRSKEEESIPSSGGRVREARGRSSGSWPIGRRRVTLSLVRRSGDMLRQGRKNTEHGNDTVRRRREGERRNDKQRCEGLEAQSCWGFFICIDLIASLKTREG